METIDFGYGNCARIVRKNPDNGKISQCRDYFFSNGFSVRAWNDGTMIVKQYVEDKETICKEYLFLASHTRILHPMIFLSAKAAIAEYCNARRPVAV